MTEEVRLCAAELPFDEASTSRSSCDFTVVLDSLATSTFCKTGTGGGDSFFSTAILFSDVLLRSEDLGVTTGGEGLLLEVETARAGVPEDCER